MLQTQGAHHMLLLLLLLLLQGVQIRYMLLGVRMRVQRWRRRGRRHWQLQRSR
jgi:hypothetical protein